ncbi:hypothetical protein J3R30DRAFT_2700583 [Lentinula aciculospora]|uniref:Uncharacterized protein n=1 Tax=Lentinula aciculospora TaxID=153920 RepID=A0A9W9DP88_9AGAR|nr:hypothetical protein J3R30DRAFT_2700583 [Lentinula aciculospora]
MYLYPSIPLSPPPSFQFQRLIIPPTQLIFYLILSPISFPFQPRFISVYCLCLLLLPCPRSHRSCLFTLFGTIQSLRFYEVLPPRLLSHSSLSSLFILLLQLTQRFFPLALPYLSASYALPLCKLLSVFRSASCRFSFSFFTLILWFLQAGAETHFTHFGFSFTSLLLYLCFPLFCIRFSFLLYLFKSAPTKCLSRAMVVSHFPFMYYSLFFLFVSFCSVGIVFNSPSCVNRVVILLVFYHVCFSVPSTKEKVAPADFELPT